MAQLQEKPENGNRGKRRAKTAGFHLDMTPMVDLAFLLLTFFMLTTTFSKLSSMKLDMPAIAKTPADSTTVSAKNALTLLLAKEDKIHYYFGFAGDKPHVFTTDYSARGIRKVLLSEQVKGNAKMLVIIKPMQESRYQNLVDVLDEARITGTPKYTLTNTDAADKELLATTVAVQQTQVSGN